MPIEVACSCGKRFRVHDSRAGRKGRCPDCGATLRGPDPADPEGTWGAIGESPPMDMGPDLASLAPIPRTAGPDEPDGPDDPDSDPPPPAPRAAPGTGPVVYPITTRRWPPVVPPQQAETTSRVILVGV